jgi:hypothetical protein
MTYCSITPLLLFTYAAGVEPSTLLLRPFIDLLYQPWMVDGGQFGAIGEINEWQRKPKYSEKITHDLIGDRTRAAAMGSQRLTHSMENLHGNNTKK